MIDPSAPPEAPSWRRLGTPVLRQLHLSGVCHEVWDALCELQGGRHRYVRAGANRLAAMTGHPRRSVFRSRKQLERVGMIRRVTTGGGRLLDPDRGSPGEASTFVLGPAVEAYQERRRRPLRVVKNGDQTDTLVRAKNGDQTDTLGTVTKRTPQVSSRRGFAPPQSTQDDEEDGRPTSPDDRPGQGSFTALGTILKAGPQPVPTTRGAVADFLATPLPRPAPDLELTPPKKRRR